MNLSATRTVRELAIEIPNATRTFEKLGIDYCCGGGKSLSDACLHAHLPVDDVLRALEQGGSFTPATESSVPDFTNGALGNLIEHIVSTHHVYVKQETPASSAALEQSGLCPWKEPSRTGQDPADIPADGR